MVYCTCRQLDANVSATAFPKKWRRNALSSCLSAMHKGPIVFSYLVRLVTIIAWSLGEFHWQLPNPRHVDTTESLVEAL